MIVFFPLPAYAYIDPGTGSMILQALAACFITCMVFFHGIRNSIIDFFKKITGKAKDTQKQTGKDE
jgi:hypothetical protein